ncbi:uncharacterized protein LOC110680924, partial [Aedes aegypti]|uniref:Uncharacterized protein n=1 Tax=Aedes aegypti TaxID=7159 RepID=A0A903VUN3_AEDAE
YHQTPSGGRAAAVQWPPRVRGLHLAVPQHGLRGVHFRSWQRASNSEKRISSDDGSMAHNQGFQNISTGSLKDRSAARSDDGLARTDSGIFRCHTACTWAECTTSTRCR